MPDTHSIDARLDGSATARHRSYGGGGGGGGPVGPGRARGFTLAGTDDLSASHPDPGSEDTFSMCGWIKTSDQTGIAKTIMGLFSSDLNDAGYLEIQLTTGGVLRCNLTQDNGLGTPNDFGSTDLRDGAWHLVACAVDGSTITVWVDDGTDTPGAHSRTFPTIDTIAIGARVDLTPNNAFDGSIDECTFWHGTKITDAHVAALFAIGNDDSVRYLEALQDSSVPTPTHHYSLSTELRLAVEGVDEIGGLDLTDNGTTDVEGIPAGEGGICLAAEFDGANHLSIDTAAVTVTDFTMLCWFRTTSSPTGVLMALQDKDLATDMTYLAVNGSSVFAVSRSSTSGTSKIATESTIDPNDGSWHFAAGDFDGPSSRTAHGDSSSTQNTETATITNTYDRTSVGVLLHSSPTAYFVGDIDNPMIFAPALTALEIAYMIANRPTRADLVVSFAAGSTDCPDPGNLAASWGLNQYSGNRPDDSGSGLDLAPGGGPPLPGGVPGIS